MKKEKWGAKPEPVRKVEKKPPKRCKCGMWMDAAATECGICDTPM